MSSVAASSEPSQLFPPESEKFDLQTLSKKAKKALATLLANYLKPAISKEDSPNITSFPTKSIPANQELSEQQSTTPDIKQMAAYFESLLNQDEKDIIPSTQQNREFLNIVHFLQFVVSRDYKPSELYSAYGDFIRLGVHFPPLEHDSHVDDRLFPSLTQDRSAKRVQVGVEKERHIPLPTPSVLDSLSYSPADLQPSSQSLSNVLTSQLAFISHESDFISISSCILKQSSLSGSTLLALLRNVFDRSIFVAQHGLHVLLWLQRREQIDPLALPAVFRELLRMMGRIMEFQNKSRISQKESLFMIEQRSQQQRVEKSRRAVILCGLCNTWREFVRTCVQHHPDCVQMSSDDALLLKSAQRAVEEKDNPFFSFEKTLLVEGVNELMTIQTDAEQVEVLKSIASRWERKQRFGKTDHLFVFANRQVENRNPRSMSILVFMCWMRD